MVLQWRMLSSDSRDMENSWFPDWGIYSVSLPTYIHVLEIKYDSLWRNLFCPVAVHSWSWPATECLPVCAHMMWSDPHQVWCGCVGSMSPVWYGQACIGSNVDMWGQWVTGVTLITLCSLSLCSLYCSFCCIVIAQCAWASHWQA